MPASKNCLKDYQKASFIPLFQTEFNFNLPAFILIPNYHIFDFDVLFLEGRGRVQKWRHKANS